MPRVEAGRLTPRICWATVWMLADSGEGTIEHACGLAKRAGFTGVLWGISPSTKEARVRYVLAVCARKGLWAGIGLQPWDVVRQGNDWSQWYSANLVPEAQTYAWARGIVERYRGDANAHRIAFWSSGVLDEGERKYGSLGAAQRIADHIARAAHDVDPCRLTMHFPRASHRSTDDVGRHPWHEVVTIQSDHSWGCDPTYTRNLYVQAPWGPVWNYEPLYSGLGHDDALPAIRAVDARENDGWVTWGDIKAACFLAGWEAAFDSEHARAVVRAWRGR